MITHTKRERAYFHKTLIIDIETVPLSYDWNSLPDSLRNHWLHKMNFLHLNEEEKLDPEAVFKNRAGIYAEFGKIVCIGMGFITEQHERSTVRLKSISGDDEKELLLRFRDTVINFAEQHKEVVFCGHNIKEFDIPYICRRMLINGISLPTGLDLGGLKPWQVPHQDTLELWRFGDYKNFTSLDLIAHVLGVPSSKGDIDGSMVADAYWQHNDLKRISEYCLRDVYTTALVYLKLKGWAEALPEAVYV
jgi:DNA polymerase elongation subunit (family B)